MIDITSTPNSLPANFKWGASTAAAQVEGAWNVDGKTPSVWDEFCHTSGRISDGSTADDAVKSYELWKEDVDTLASYGATAYRFSISWTRIIPGGGRDEPINEKGVAYYSNLIDRLLANGITPYVTIWHWCTPLSLQKKYGGFTNAEEISKDLTRLADVLFERLGDRVTNWITLNEPHISTMLHSFGFAGPWNAETDMYKMSHALILTHASIVNLYRTKYQPTQKGTIGITLSCDWAEPINDSPEASWAAQRRLDQALGWFADPIYLGHYPKSIEEEAGDKLIPFTPEQWALIKGSSEFFGLNSYSTALLTGERGGMEVFGNVKDTQTREDGTLIGLESEVPMFKFYPQGFGKLLHYIHNRYTKNTDISIAITENGWPRKDESKMSFEEIINDEERQEYFKGYLTEVEKAVQNGVKIHAYMAWSFLDNMEWMSGFTPRFGITYVDKENGYKRIPKDSSKFLTGWFDQAISKKPVANGVH